MWDSIFITEMPKNMHDFSKSLVLETVANTYV